MNEEPLTVVFPGEMRPVEPHSAWFVFAVPSAHDHLPGEEDA